MQKYSIITHLTHYSLFFYAVTNQNNLYRECVLQINPKTYEYSVCKSCVIMKHFLCDPTISLDSHIHKMVHQQIGLIAKSFSIV